MIEIKTLTIKNFQSFGNVSQAISFQNGDFVLVLGQNTDLGGDNNRNGTGKSAVLNALSYGFYGSSLSKSKKDNLVNNINNKNMLVTIEFIKDNAEYRIERGRKPNILKFYKNNKMLSAEDSDNVNEAKGENRITQKDIEETIGISQLLFKHLIALNTYTIPFLSSGAGEQREVIEELFGISKLSKKALSLKDLLGNTNNIIGKEEVRIKTMSDNNDKTKQLIRTFNNKLNSWVDDNKQTIESLETQIKEYASMDLEKEKQSIKTKELIKEEKQLNKLIQNKVDGIDKAYKQIEAINNKINKIITEDECPTCEQSLSNTESSKKILERYKQEAKELQDKIDDDVIEVDRLTVSIPIFDHEAYIKDQHYESLEEIYEHENNMNTLRSKLSIAKTMKNPYTEQVKALQESLQEVDKSTLKTLNYLKEHQSTLYKLLTNKNSFIRKSIINNNIMYLNQRLEHYLDEIGLPHRVKFNADLSVDIQNYGRDIDFESLSRGERTRLSLGLSWSFRDLYESLNGKINLVFIDEYLDNGIDGAGIESCFHSIKSMSRQNKRVIYLISHKEELLGRFNKVLNVIKTDGFSVLED